MPSGTGGASVIAFSTIDVTPQREREEKRTEMTAQREELLYESIVTLRLLNGRRHNDKNVSGLVGVLSYSIHIQFFSQNQSLLFEIK